MRVLFLFPYPLGCAASQRFRFEQYLQTMKDEGFTLHLVPFLGIGTWKIFYRKGYYFHKFFALLNGIWKRFTLIFIIRKFDYIFIHRESLPIGPPLFEWLVSKIFNRRIIFDFDDAIWIANSSESNRFFSPLKARSGFFDICRWSYKISAGNEYLANSVKPYNPNIIINPTTIDTVSYHNRIAEHKSKILTIGWTGSHSTNKYLDPLFPVIMKLREELDFRFLIISDEEIQGWKDLFEFRYWSKDREIDDLLEINIGLMPLTHDPWTEGKCGFKALQYMALGIPAIVSPVGVNERIVDDGVNGYICRTDTEWFGKISYLLQNLDVVREMGLKARRKIVESYSVESNKSKFINLFS